MLAVFTRDTEPDIAVGGPAVGSIEAKFSGRFVSKSQLRLGVWRISSQRRSRTPDGHSGSNHIGQT